MTGKHKSRLRQNAREEQQAHTRAQAELDQLRFAQLAERRDLQRSIDVQVERHQEEYQALLSNIIAQVDKPIRQQLKQALTQSVQSLIS